MYKYLVLIFIIVPIHHLHAAANSSSGTITSIESRETGLHDIYFSNDIPGEGCILTDRAAINEITSPIGSKTMLSVAIAAMMSGKTAVIRVDGCTDDRPKIVKIKILI